MDASEARFTVYVDELVSVIGHADRAGPLRDYCTGLLSPLDRKSVEPMAAVTAPERVAAQHQSLLHFVGQSPWSDERVLAKVRDLVLPSIEAHGPIEAWIIDDTGHPKKGRHSVGVSRQYCGESGKRDNCQVAVSLSVANHQASLPVAWRLYLPKAWAEDAQRRETCGIPDEVTFQTKIEIALDQIGQAHAAGIAPGVVLMDTAYGKSFELRTGIAALGLDYIAGVPADTLVFAPGFEPPPGHQRATNARREPNVLCVEEVARSLPATAWQTITWRQGVDKPLSGRFARLRIRVASRHPNKGEWPEQWLLIEWPEDEGEPVRYWLSTLGHDLSFERLVDLTKLRWRIERDYLELKQELGLGHYEGRGWRGFHHHATLCIAAYGFLISERETIPPSGARPARSGAKVALPRGYQPRGAAAAA
jgi:SRSO17 transposase